MYNEIGVTEVVANSVSSLSFSGVTLIAVITLAAAFWCAVPFMLFTMWRRIGQLETSLDQSVNIISADVRRVSDILLLNRMQGAQTKAEPQAEIAPETSDESESESSVKAIIAEAEAAVEDVGSRPILANVPANVPANDPPHSFAPVAAVAAASPRFTPPRIVAGVAPVAYVNGK